MRNSSLIPKAVAKYYASKGVFGNDCLSLSVVDLGTGGCGTWVIRMRVRSGSECDGRNSGTHSAVGRMSGF